MCASFFVIFWLQRPRNTVLSKDYNVTETKILEGKFILLNISFKLFFINLFFYIDDVDFGLSPDPWDLEPSNCSAHITQALQMNKLSQDTNSQPSQITQKRLN